MEVPLQSPLYEVMRHAAFFEALAEAQEGDSAWELTTIGYFIIRCLDDWHMLGGAQLSVDSSVERVRTKIENLGPANARYAHVFREVLQVLTGSPEANATSVVAPALAYASLLEADTKWALAADVYGTIADTLSDSKLAETADAITQGFARRREAFALRNVGEFDIAEVRYRQAIIVSDRVKDFRNVHLSRIGLANLSRVKGNLPESFNALTDLINEWEGGFYPHIENALAELLQTRGAILHEMGRYDEAIQSYFDAYQASNDQIAKNVILNDLASCAMHTGYFEFAHDALALVVHRTDVNQIRQLALINLMYLSIAQDDEISFLRFQKQWQLEAGDIVMNATVRLVTAMSFERFGTAEQALAAFQEAAQFATESRIARVQFDALAHIDRLQGLTHQRNANLPAPAVVPSFLWSAADALSHEYQLAITRHQD